MFPQHHIHAYMYAFSKICCQYYLINPFTCHLNEYLSINFNRYIDPFNGILTCFILTLHFVRHYRYYICHHRHLRTYYFHKILHVQPVHKFHKSLIYLMDL